MKKITSTIIVFCLIYITITYAVSPKPEKVFHHIGSTINKAQQQFTKGFSPKPEVIRIHVPIMGKDSITLKR